MSDKPPRLRNGRPTIKFIEQLCERHDLRIYALGRLYSSLGFFNWPGYPRASQVTAAEKVRDELIAFGFEIVFTPARIADGITGRIEIKAKS